MEEREKNVLARIGQQGRQLRENLEKARARMEQTGSERDKRLFEEAFKKWRTHVESWRKLIEGRKGAISWQANKRTDSATKTGSTGKNGKRGYDC